MIIVQIEDDIRDIPVCQSVNRVICELQGGAYVVIDLADIALPRRRLQRPCGQIEHTFHYGCHDTTCASKDIRGITPKLGTLVKAINNSGGTWVSGYKAGCDNFVYGTFESTYTYHFSLYVPSILTDVAIYTAAGVYGEQSGVTRSAIAVKCQSGQVSRQYYNGSKWVVVAITGTWYHKE